MLLRLRVVCSVLAVSLMLGGLVMSAAYLRTHSDPDFKCDTFTQKVNVSFNMTTGQFQLTPENHQFLTQSPDSNPPIQSLNSTFCKSLVDKYGISEMDMKDMFRTCNMSSYKDI